MYELQPGRQFQRRQFNTRTQRRLVRSSFHGDVNSEVKSPSQFSRRLWQLGSVVSDSAMATQRPLQLNRSLAPIRRASFLQPNLHLPPNTTSAQDEQPEQRTLVIYSNWQLCTKLHKTGDQTVSNSRTTRVIHMPNFVQICAIVNELWAIDKIQNGGRCHLEFFIFVHFGQMV